jgi:hypothetical protein
MWYPDKKGVGSIFGIGTDAVTGLDLSTLRKRTTAWARAHGCVFWECQEGFLASLVTVPFASVNWG